jgi:hypothetical protein
MMDDPVIHPSNSSAGERRRSSRLRSTSQGLSETPGPSTRSTPIKSVQDTPQDDKQSLEDESPVPQRSLRQRRSAIPHGTVSIEEVMKPLTDEERRDWKGWVELESDPVSPLSPSLLQDDTSRTTVAIQGLTANIRLCSATFYDSMVSKISRSKRSSGSMMSRCCTFRMPRHQVI